MVRRFLRPLLVFLFWVVLWEVIGRSGVVSMIPPLSTVLGKVGVIMGGSQIYEALRVTAEAWVLGFGLSLLVGIPAGIWMARSRRAERTIGMWVNVLISAPTVALVPAMMPLLGIGQAIVVATVFLFTVFIIIIDTEAGIRSVSPSLVEMAVSFGASRAQLWRKVLLVAALPEILAGIRLGVIRATKGVVVGQLLVAVYGIGGMVDTYVQSFLVEYFWAMILIIACIGIGLAQAVSLMEKRVEHFAGDR